MFTNRLFQITESNLNTSETKIYKIQEINVIGEKLKAQNEVNEQRRIVTFFNTHRVNAMSLFHGFDDVVKIEFTFE